MNFKMHLKHYLSVLTVVICLALSFGGSYATEHRNCSDKTSPNVETERNTLKPRLEDKHINIFHSYRRGRADLNFSDKFSGQINGSRNHQIDPRGLTEQVKEQLQDFSQNKVIYAISEEDPQRLELATGEETLECNYINETPGDGTVSNGCLETDDPNEQNDNSIETLDSSRSGETKSRGVRSEGSRSSAENSNRRTAALTRPKTSASLSPSSSARAARSSSSSRRGNEGDHRGQARRLEAQVIQLKTELGAVTGTLEFSQRATTPPTAGRRYYSFRGIPYAEPPVGPLRFAPPVLLTKEWPGGRVDGRRHKSFCPQYDHDYNKVVGNEDCLYLNVYTPFLDGERSRLLPVLVFIHGGAYSRGAASSHGPQRLMTKDMVVVTMNYRLGVLGFLSTGTEQLAGNYGALDQVAALQWIQQHIRPFGGDHAQVTLGGFSAGAGFVHLHMLSQLSKGLFHRVILMSGAGNCQWSVQQRPLDVATELAEDTDCSVSSSQGFLDCLRAKSVDELIQAQTDRQRYVYWPYQYRPVVDGGLREAPFLPLPVKELMAKPPASPVPVLGGTTKHEGVLFALTTILFSRNPGSASQVHEEAAMYLLGCLWPNTSSTQDIARTLHSFYYSPIARDNLDELLQQMAEAMTDQLFTSCLWDAFEHMAASTKAHVYTYLMTHHDPGSPSFAYSLYRLAHDLGIRSPLLQAGVSHGDDVILLFSFPHSLVQPGTRDMQMSDVLTNIWYSFVATGSPQGTPQTRALPPWSPVRSGEPVSFYRLSLTPGMERQSFRRKERNFWQQTLAVVEDLSDELEGIVSWQIATWVLSVLCTLLLVALLLVVVGILLARRRRTYPPGTATLRSRQPRSSTYGGPGVNAT